MVNGSLVPCRLVCLVYVFAAAACGAGKAKVGGEVSEDAAPEDPAAPDARTPSDASKPSDVPAAVPDAAPEAGPLIVAACASPVVAAPVSMPPHDVTPAQWLKEQPRPFACPDHTLPRLTRYGWVLPLDARIELTEHWGYGLEYGGYVDDAAAARLAQPDSDESKLAVLVKSDPKRYPLAVITSRKMPGTEAPPETWVRDKDGKVLNGQAQSMDGTVWSEEKGAIFSPEAPDVVWNLAGEYRAAPLRELQKQGVPISIVLNGGEYGLGVLGFGQPIWSKDPRIVAAVGQGSWRDYASSKKGHAERLIADVVRQAVPGRKLYVYYTAGGRTLRNKDWAIDDWGAQWTHMRGVSDVPSNEVYYRHFNDGFTGRLNLLTLALNAAGAEIASGDTLSYNWVCGGWTRGNAQQYIADIDRWTGFLKAYYTAGMIGENVGYYEFPPGGFGATFRSDAPPAWLQQLAASAHVHALFSQVEEIVRNSDLLPGPMRHEISTDDPAYEFPTGDETLRVLARRHRSRAEWLLTTWASDGADRSATVSLPELGRLTLKARVVGSVYRAALKDGRVTLVQIDEEGRTITHAALATAVVAPVDLKIDSPTSDGQVLWLAADAGVTRDETGKVLSWKSQVPGSLTLTQTMATRRPDLVDHAINDRPALHFDQGRVSLINGDLKAAGDAFVGPLTVFTVWRGAVVNGDNRIISGVCANGVDYINGTGFKVTDGVTAAVAPKDSALLKVTGAELKTPLVGLVVGEMWGSGPGFTGDLAEIIIYKGVLPGTKSALVRRYLDEKYGLRAP